MSLEVLLNTYRHHHPDYLSDAVEKIVQRDPAAERKRDVSGAITGAVIKLPTGKRSKATDVVGGPGGFEPPTRRLCAVEKS
jgi:hypothetical protein